MPDLGALEIRGVRVRSVDGRRFIAERSLNSTPIEEARRTLDSVTRAVLDACRQKSALAGLDGQTILGSIHRLVATVQHNIQLDRVRVDCIQDQKHKRGALAAHIATRTGELRAVRENAETLFPALCNRAANVSGVEAIYSLSRFDNIVSRPPDTDAGTDQSSFSSGLEPEDILMVLLTEQIPKLGTDPKDENLVGLVNAILSPYNDLRFARRALHLAKATHPATAWAFLVNVVSDSNPAPGTPAWLVDRGSDGEPFRFYRKYLFEPHNVGTQDLAWLVGFREEVAAAVTTVRADFAARLGTKASLTWLVHRYAQRCRWLRLKELRRTLETWTREEERFLARDAARFLFDQGFDVRIEESIGQQRYDIVGPTLIIEAKVYNGNKSGNMTIGQGLWQLHQYVTALGNEGRELEPILLVFRVGNRGLDIPAEHSIGNVRIAIVMVDLGDAPSKGSAPDIVTAESLGSLMVPPDGPALDGPVES